MARWRTGGARRRKRLGYDKYPWGDVDTSLPWRHPGKGGEQRVALILLAIFGTVSIILALWRYFDGIIN